MADFKPLRTPWGAVDFRELERRAIAANPGHTAPYGNKDKYRERAAKIFGVAERDVTPEQRRVAKCQMYAELYTRVTYSTARAFETEGDMYESITGRRSAPLDEAEARRGQK